MEAERRHLWKTLGKRLKDMSVGKHRSFLLLMLTSFLWDTQDTWEMKFLKQHLTWVTKIRPYKEPVNTALEVLVSTIYLVGLPL